MGDNLTPLEMPASSCPVPHSTVLRRKDPRLNFLLREGKRRLADRLGKDGVRRRRRRSWVFAHSAALLSRDCQGELVELCDRQFAEASNDLGDEAYDHPRRRQSPAPIRLSGLPGGD